MTSTSTHRRAVVSLICIFLSASVGAQSPAQPVAGEIIAVEGTSIRFKPVNGEPTTLHLAPDVRLSARSPGAAELLIPGAYIGATAVPQAEGTLHAVEVHVFPDSMRGTSEGHRPMQGAAEGSTMTNATVSSVAGGEHANAKSAGSTMTNAAVSQVTSAGSQRRLTLTYRGGEKVVIVDEQTAITRYEAADRSLLVPGAHIIAYVVHGTDGALIAQRITVGKDGFVPHL